MSGSKRSKRILEPTERISEILFGLIMALTITGTISVAEAGRPEVRTMLLAALGCNLAWGIIDAGMYLMACLGLRGHGIVMLRSLEQRPAPAEARRIVADALPPVVASVMAPEELDAISRKLLASKDVSDRSWLSGRDWLGALAVALLVFFSTLPLVVPFIVDGNVARAMLMSRIVGIVMLFLAGYAFGRHAGLNGWVVGAAMVVIGVLLVAMTVALGG